MDGRKNPTVDEMRNLKIKTLFDWQNWLLLLIALGLLAIGAFIRIQTPTVMVSHETGESLGCLVGLDDRYLEPNDPECQKIFKSGHFVTEIWP